MPEKTIRPSTIDGIKSLAKSLKRDKGIKHNEALDLAAQAAGYSNFTNANREIGGQTRRYIWITARWFDRANKARGQETLKVAFVRTYGELVSPSQAANDRYLGNVRAEAPDHLVILSMSEDQELARRRVCEVARTLQFIEATGLKPSDSRRTYPKGRFDNRVPDQDHTSVWWDPENCRHVRADEPYVRAEGSISGERLAWAARHGWEIVKPAWGSMYWTDGGCWLFLMADRSKGPSIASFADALQRAPRPVAASRWTGISGEYHAQVDTPGTRAAAAARAVAVPKVRKPARKRASIAYTMSFVGRRLRPNARMPVEVHQEVGGLLKSVLVAAERRDGARTRVDRIRSELDEWVMREYTTQELDQKTFSDLYYHELDGGPQPPIDRQEMIGRLERAKAILAQHYPDCPPLDAVIGQADRAIASLASWRN
ncbi:DUF5623 domain-containing protein [Sphingomonas sp. A2-49]|uniref:DUF5623 domain-containing protein n=1 Tax=Sphingomonas sp. A2-49 TaxID=1391375 RepID=UPI0021CEF5DF|nr:DUF5623 domain-containing protein [Sphingomonas sp. A2-49]MCU6453057.1 DUF5623 domain-containing protein [Sphingomonas sp. A2-49]